MSRQYKCISGDGHIDLNPDIWRDRVQKQYRDRAPKRVKMPNGSDAVVIDGGKPNTIGITRSVRVAHGVCSTLPNATPPREPGHARWVPCGRPAAPA